ncbi:MAG: hypothetical protein GC161_11740 [Planctomycetaceae bacterium]|nr:hypothetical protein [Planctomycetaceae bacterium]
MKTARHHNSAATRVLQRIRAMGRGSAFVPADFLALDSASREAVDAALGRLADAGTIRRIGRGVYDFPKPSRFGPRTPSPDAVASAVARSTNETVVISDAKAANLLGVSTQVPAQAVYLTNGTNRVVPVTLGDGRGFDIRFKRVSPSRMLGSDTKAGLVLRALHFLGRDGVDDATVRRLRAALDKDDLRRLGSLRAQATGWMRSIIDSILTSNTSVRTNSNSKSANSPSILKRSKGTTATTGAADPVA